jgi:DNA (cytosine-5)-methyltransferase 1
VFVVGHLGDWRRAAAVLFERESLSGNSAPRRQAGQGAAERAKDGPGNGRWPALVSPTLNAAYADKMGLENQNALSGGGLFVPDYSNSITAHNGARNEVSDILNGSAVVEVAPCLPASGRGFERAGETRGQDCVVSIGWRVRRLTPTECERLQGFPDGYTNIPYRNKNDAPDGPRYKALGNSMAVNAMRWIGRRIKMVDAMETTHV